MRYAIEETTLTALGDAVRKQVGQTREEMIPFDFHECNVNKEEVINSDNREIIKEFFIPGAVKYKVIVNGVIGDPNGYAGIIDATIQHVNVNENGETSLSDSWTHLVYDAVCENQEFIVATRSDASIYNRLRLKFAFYNNYDSDTTKFDVNLKVYGINTSGNIITEMPIIVENTMTLSQMAEKINGLEAIPEEASTITGNCANKFSYGGWNWFVDIFGNRITTKDITNLTNMCYQSNIKNIPFDLNIISPFGGMNHALSFVQSTGQPPLIKGELNPPTSAYSGTMNMDNLFYNSKFSSIPYDYFHNFGGDAFWEASKKYTGGSRQQIFYGCVNLRNLPDISMLLNASTSSYNNFYYGTFYNCHALDEAVNIPVANHCTYTSNMFSNIVDTVTRLKRFTFAVQEDGTPYVCNWKNQTIEFNKQVGYNPYGYGKYELFPQGKEVIDEATYNALKDDPDWHTKDINYARYNHNGAVETINSLPDCSSSGGVNTIKFKGAAGALTDGGAISNLTEEEIAVAAAKGWTVSFA